MSKTLSEVLSPETVFGRRGNEKYLKLYKDFHRKIEYSEEGWGISVPEELLKDQPFMSHMVITKKFALEKPPVYRLGNDFGETLFSVKNDIPMDKLPENFFGYISFSKTLLSDEDGPIHGAYVYIGDAKGTSSHPNMWGKRVFWASVVGEFKKIPNEFCFQHLLMPIADSFEKTFMALEQKDHLYTHSRAVTEDIKDIRCDIFRCLVNSVLYINSLEPNIEHLRPLSNLTHGQRRRERATGKNMNLCTVPVVAINWGYKRERMFGVSETWVNEFMRWQRCGVGFSEIKLIVVKGHPRKFKNVRESDEAGES